MNIFCSIFWTQKIKKSFTNLFPILSSVWGSIIYLIYSAVWSPSREFKFCCPFPPPEMYFISLQTWSWNDQTWSGINRTCYSEAGEEIISTSLLSGSAHIMKKWIMNFHNISQLKKKTNFLLVQKALFLRFEFWKKSKQIFCNISWNWEILVKFGISWKNELSSIYNNENKQTMKNWL